MFGLLFWPLRAIAGTVWCGVCNPQQDPLTLLNME
jgi:hypothetical protein